MKKRIIFVATVFFLTTSLAFSQGAGMQKERLVTALDGIMNSSSFRLSGLAAWDDDEVISRMEWVITNTVDGVFSQISYLKPSEQRDVYTLYSDLLRFKVDLDFQFQVARTLRNLCDRFPSLKSRSLLWIFTSRASGELSDLATRETSEEKSE